MSGILNIYHDCHNYSVEIIEHLKMSSQKERTQESNKSNANEQLKAQDEKNLKTGLSLSL